MKKLLVICGPTATGKTALGVKLAKKFNGEIISADSRQVYKYMDIGTGKDLPLPVPVWGLDLVRPNQEFSVSHWVKFAHKVIQNIWTRKKLPIIVGGTGFWIKALIDGVDSVGIPPDWKLRKKLSHCSITSLLHCLEKLDPERMRRMNKSDRNNSRRLIRAIEIALQVKSEKLKVLSKGWSSSGRKSYSSKLKVDKLLTIGLKTNNKTLYQRIDKRVDKRIKQGAQKEVRTLIKKGYFWNLPAMSAIGYKEWQGFLEDSVSLDKVIQRWKYNEHAYARRQMTWFRKPIRQAFGKIHWFDIENADWKNDIVKLAKSWYYCNNGTSWDFS